VRCIPNYWLKIWNIKKKILDIGRSLHFQNYRTIRSIFWRFYLNRTSFTLGEPVSLVKVFRLFKLEQIFFGVQSVDTVGRCTTSYLLAEPACLWRLCCFPVSAWPLRKASLKKVKVPNKEQTPSSRMGIQTRSSSSRTCKRQNTIISITHKQRTNAIIFMNMQRMNKHNLQNMKWTNIVMLMNMQRTNTIFKKTIQRTNTNVFKK